MVWSIGTRLRLCNKNNIMHADMCDWVLNFFRAINIDAYKTSKEWDDGVPA